MQPQRDPARASGQRKIVSIVHADLSGSTPLAERLDPEELRGLLGTFFNALAREVRRFGGAVDKYIGDAVRVVFEGPISPADDAFRAVSAALAMQEAVQRENVELERRYGARLALRIGVCSDEVVAGGDDPSEATIGEAVTVAQRLEGAAAPNTVLASASTERLVAERFRLEAVAPVPRKDRDGSISAFRVVAALARVGGADAAEGAVARGGGRGASLQVSESRAHALAEQRKIVTILFADLASPLPPELRPEQVRDVLAAYFGTIAREIRRFGGTVDKFIGDAVMAVFGAPISHEDDAARAVHAALAIRRELAKQNEALQRTFGVRLQVRIGVNTGEVVAGLLEGEVLAYTITGDAVNTAQRLESAANADEIITGETTEALARQAIVFQPIPPLTLKGKAEPVPAYRVVGLERRASARGSYGLVGRTDELRRLFELLREASAGRGQVLHLFGEAGVGKSRLVGEFLGAAGEGVDRFRARASSYETATPYALVADLIRRTFGIQRGEAEAAAREAVGAGLAPLPFAGGAAIDLFLEVLGYAVTSPVPPERKAELLIALLTGYVRHRGETRPVVIVLEDVHWCDPASASVLRAVAAAARTQRCFLVSTGRDEGMGWDATPLPLAPLDATLAMEMTTRVAGKPLDERVRALILERTSGNPFFIEEVVRALVSGRTATVPATVRDLLESKVDALDAGPKRVAQQASVIGRTFFTRVLERVTPEERVEPALATLQAERFVAPYESTPERKYIFNHALLQEVLYETQLLARRRVAHGEVGVAIEDIFHERVEEYTDILAFQFDRSDRDDKALFWLSRAGDRAKALFANDEAIALYRSALKRAPNGGAPLDAPALLERMSDVQRMASRFDDAVASCDDAARRLTPPDPAILARLRRKVGLALRMKGDLGAALAAYADGLVMLGDDDHPEAASLHAWSGDAYWRRGDYDRAREEIERALAIAERSGNDEIRAECLNQLGVIAQASGDLASAVDHYTRCLPLVERLGDRSKTASLQNNMGMAYRRLGRYDESLEVHRSALALRETTGSLVAIGQSHHNIGSALRSRGDLVDAIAALDRSLEFWRPAGYASGVANTLMLRGATRVALGDLADGLADLLDAEAKFLALDSRANLPELYRHLASAALAAGELDSADAYAARSLEFARQLKARQQEAATTRVLGEIALARGDLATARSLLEPSREALAAAGEVDELRQTEAVIARLPAA